MQVQATLEQQSSDICALATRCHVPSAGVAGVYLHSSQRHPPAPSHAWWGQECLASSSARGQRLALNAQYVLIDDRVWHM